MSVTTATLRAVINEDVQLSHVDKAVLLTERFCLQCGHAMHYSALDVLNEKAIPASKKNEAWTIFCCMCGAPKKYEPGQTIELREG